MWSQRGTCVWQRRAMKIVVATETHWSNTASSLQLYAHHRILHQYTTETSVVYCCYPLLINITSYIKAATLQEHLVKKSRQILPIKCISLYVLSKALQDTHVVIMFVKSIQSLHAFLITYKQKRLENVWRNSMFGELALMFYCHA